MPGSGKDGHLPCPRLASPRSPRSSSSRHGSSSPGSGRRGSSSSSRTGSSSSTRYSVPSSRSDPSDHSWDSPGWHPLRCRPLSPTRLLFLEAAMWPVSPRSCWRTRSSEKARRKSAAAAAAAHQKKLEKMRYINEQRHASLLFPPTRNSPEDYARIYRLGIHELGGQSTRKCNAPIPYWCDEGDESSSDSEKSDDSPPPSPRFVKSEGGVSQAEPGFSIPFVNSDPYRTRTKAWKARAKAIHGRELFPEDADLDEEVEREAQLTSDELAANYLDIKGLLDPTCRDDTDQNMDKTPEEIRKTFNIKNDLTPEAANYLDIKGLLDPTCRDDTDQNMDKTPEEIRKTFNIKNDLTPEGLLDPTCQNVPDHMVVTPEEIPKTFNIKNDCTPQEELPACQNAADSIMGKTPEEIHKIFNIKNDA